jgi:hypothetical protein
MESLRSGAVYCPSPKAYTMSLATVSQLKAFASGAGYKSLYGSERQDFDQLSARKETFVFFPSWVPRSISPADMVATGLYYTGEGDIVKCFSCKHSFHTWKEGDVPAERHHMESPNCQFLARSRLEAFRNSRRRDSEDSEDSDCIDGSFEQERLTLNSGSLTSDVEIDGPVDNKQSVSVPVDNAAKQFKQLTTSEAMRTSGLKKPATLGLTG